MKTKYGFTRTRGFTLVELLVVIAIIGFLAAVVLPQFVKRIGQGMQASARVQIRSFEDALEMYNTDMHQYPSTEQGLQSLVNPVGSDTGNWNGPYLRKALPRDPWKRDYIYICPGQHGDYDIVSYGKDGVAGGTGENADITNWEEGDTARGWGVEQRPGYSQRQRL